MAGADGTTERVRVVCRFRPLNSREIGEWNGDIHRATCIESLYENSVKLRGKKKPYVLDEILDENCTQTDAFLRIAQPVVDNVLNGFNSTIFAYGHTGSGKTHTILGGRGDDRTFVTEQLGLVFRSVAQIFQSLARMEETLTSYTVSVSCVEIYLSAREVVRDLLTLDQHDNPRELDIRVTDKGTRIYYTRTKQEIENHKILSLKDAIANVERANTRRQQSATKSNAESSRSHMIIIFTVQTEMSDGRRRRAVLNYADLAGSERRKSNASADETAEMRTKRENEALGINKSLTFLRNVMTALANGRTPSFRDTMLTRILRDSLTGNTKTTLVLCVSPFIGQMDETIRSLDFGKGAKNITVRVHRNETLTRAQLEAKLKRYEKLIKALRLQLKESGINPTTLREVKNMNVEDLDIVSENQDANLATSAMDEDEKDGELFYRRFSDVNDGDLLELEAIGTRNSVNMNDEEESQIVELQEMNATLMEEKEGLESEKRNIEAELAQLQDSMAQSEREMDELKAKLVDKDRQYQELVDSGAGGGDQLSAKVQELYQLQNELEESKKLNEAYVEHVAQLTAQVNSYEQEREHLEQMRDMIVADGERQKDVKRLLAEGDLPSLQGRSRASLVVADHLSYLSELFPDSGSVLQFEEKNKAVMEQMSVERDNLKELQMEHDSKVNRLQERESELMERTEQILRREIEVDQYKAKLQEFTQKMEAMRERERQLEQREQELQMQQSRITEARTTLEDRQSEHDKRVSSFEEQWVRSNEAKASQEAAIDSFLTQLREQQQENQQTIENLRAEKDAHAQSLQTIRLKELDLERKAADLQRRVDDGERAETERNAQLRIAQEALNEREKEVQEAQARVQAKQSELTQQKLELDEAKEEASTVRERAIRALDQVELERKKIALLYDQYKAEKASLQERMQNRAQSNIDDMKEERQFAVKISIVDGGLPEDQSTWTAKLDPLEPLRNLFGTIAKKLDDETFDFAKYTIEVGTKDVISGREDLDRLIASSEIKPWHHLIVRQHGRKDPRYLHVGIRMKGDSIEQPRFTVKLLKGSTVRELITLVAEKVSLVPGTFTLVGKGKFLGFEEDLDLNLSSFGDFDNTILLCRESFFKPQASPNDHSNRRNINDYSGHPIGSASEHGFQGYSTPERRRVAQGAGGGRGGMVPRPMHSRRGSNGSSASYQSEPPRRPQFQQSQSAVVPRGVSARGRGGLRPRGRGRGGGYPMTSPRAYNQPHPQEYRFPRQEEDRNSTASMPAFRGPVRRPPRGQPRGRGGRGRGGPRLMDSGSVHSAVGPYRGPGSDAGSIGPYRVAGSDVGAPTYGSSNGGGQRRPQRRGLDPNAVKYVMKQCGVSLKDASAALMRANGNPNMAIQILQSQQASPSSDRPAASRPVRAESNR